MTKIASTALLQNRLAAAGYDPGPADGWFGARTLAAECSAVIGVKGGITTDLTGPMWAQMQRFGIITPLRVVNFVANCGAESRFDLVAENLNYSPERLLEVWPRRFPNLGATQGFARNPRQLANAVYGGRMGNTQVGDGFLFRGRAWPQLTGREAYREVGDLVAMDFEANPDLVLTPEGAAAAAAGFWEWKGLSRLADANNTKGVRLAWNGGLNGWPDVAKAVGLLKSFWGMG